MHPLQNRKLYYYFQNVLLLNTIEHSRPTCKVFLFLRGVLYATNYYNITLYIVLVINSGISSEICVLVSNYTFPASRNCSIHKHFKQITKKPQRKNKNNSSNNITNLVCVAYSLFYIYYC